jgi:poly-gamma-glutamate capsule biosynthesis protein CapA/YwtB (metallophosphatase superfamily)
MRRQGFRSISSRAMIGRALMPALVAVVAACGSPTPSRSPAASISMAPTPWSSPSASATATPSPSPTPTPTSAPTVFPIAVVVRFDDARPSITPQALTAAATAGQLLVPCEVTGLSLDGQALAIPATTTCEPAAQVATAIHTTAKIIGLLPPGLVSPSVKVLPIGLADLFGAPTHRALPYPLMAQTTTAATWTSYDVNDVRTLISTGDTCPDRGVSLMAVTNRKGWDWTLAGGNARYTSTHMDTQYSGPQGKGWPVPTIRRNGGTGAMAALISDNDVSANDFECPMVANWTQHNSGMLFTIDPRVAQTLATKGGLKVVTLGSNHITNAGKAGVRETLRWLDAAGIKHTGAGNNLADALAPAVVDVRGVKFAFVGWDDIKGSAAATASSPGVAPMTDANVCSSIKAARQVADIVIAMPQWGWPEYHATITKQQITQRAFFYQCGADGILGSGTHWASWASILPGPNGPQFAIGSHGNFLFDQNWSQQTMEGVVVEVTFVGTRLAQFRLHPYVVTQGAQPNLIDPLTDGKYVLQRVWSVSDVR